MKNIDLYNDSDLMDEFKHRMIAPGFRKMVKNLSFSDEALDQLISTEGLPEQASAETEAIIRLFGRPALLVQDGTFETSMSEVWKSKLDRSRQYIESAIAAVGRVEVKNHPDYFWVGTGWMITESIMVTNRHVAREFSRKDADGYVFKKSVSGRVISGCLDFAEEYMRANELERKFVRVVHIEEEPGADLAFVELEPGGNTMTENPLVLSDGAFSNADVAVIGYPAEDGRRNEPAPMTRIFAGIYNVKRLQPGKILNSEGDYLIHDCSTMGGNSGSPVIDLSNGQVVGLHFAGSYREQNYAVSSQVIMQLLEQHV